MIVAYMHAFLIWKRTVNSTVDKDISKDVRNIKDLKKTGKDLKKTGKDLKKQAKIFKKGKDF